jgi:hypothetical protein
MCLVLDALIAFKLINISSHSMIHPLASSCPSFEGWIEIFRGPAAIVGDGLVS